MNCPRCGAPIDQPELPLGPIEFRVPEKFSKKKLDNEIQDLVKFIDSVFEDANASVDSVGGYSATAYSRYPVGGYSFDATASINLIVGDDELRRNAALWRFRCKTPIHRDAIRYAVFKWNGLTEIKKRSIRNPAAWLTNLYKGALPIFAKAKKSA